jgi:aconitate hydratase
MNVHSIDSLGTLDALTVGDSAYAIFSLARAEETLGARIRRLPVSLRVLLENLLRHEDGETVTGEDLAALAAWVEDPHSERGIALHPVRVVLPDSSGVPMLADLAAMRDAMRDAGDDPRQQHRQ